MRDIPLDLVDVDEVKNAPPQRERIHVTSTCVVESRQKEAHKLHRWTDVTRDDFCKLLLLLMALQPAAGTPSHTSSTQASRAAKRRETKGILVVIICTFIPAFQRRIRKKSKIALKISTH